MDRTSGMPPWRRDHSDYSDSPNYASLPPYRRNGSGNKFHSKRLYNSPGASRQGTPGSDSIPGHKSRSVPSFTRGCVAKRSLKNDWLFPASELATSTPSVKEGMPYKVELIQRGKGVNFIVQVGSHLKLPQMTVNAASTFFHRFYVRHAMHKFHYYDMGATCLFLATKVEETNRRLRDVAIACTKIASKNPKLVVDEQSKDYWRWRDTILLNEDVLLEALCFDMSLESPYSLLLNYVEKLGVGHLTVLKKCAWAFVNDSCRTTLCIMYPTKVISAAAIYWASKYTKNDIPPTASGESAWWDLLEVEKSAIKDACNIMADLYESLLGNYQADVTQKYVRVTSPQDLQRSSGNSAYSPLAGSGNEPSDSMKRKAEPEEDQTRKEIKT